MFGVGGRVILGGRLIQRDILPPKTKMTEELSKCGWDDPLPSAYAKKWTEWKDSLNGLSQIKIPRCVIASNFIDPKRELHIFADASDLAIGYVCYLKSENQAGDTHVSFLTGNSKVAPRAATTIPRLELCAAVEAAQSGAKIVNELNVKPSEVTFYSDSNIVLAYIASETKRFTRYISNRVSTIRSHSNPQQWRYVTTADNPADLASRAQTPTELKESMWLAGPAFLRNNSPLALQATQPEELPEELKETKILLSKIGEPSLLTTLCTRVNNWNKVVFTTVNIFRMFHHLEKARQRLGIALAPRCPNPTHLKITLFWHFRAEIEKL